MTDLTRQLRTLNAEELERIYYQAGLTDLAAVYARCDDLETENADMKEQLESAPDPDAFKEQEKLIEHLQEHIREAGGAVDDLYGWVEHAERLDRKRILAALANIALDPDSEP